jgi:hypothetical protein
VSKECGKEDENCEGSEAETENRNGEEREARETKYRPVISRKNRAQ